MCGRIAAFSEAALGNASTTLAMAGIVAWPKPATKIQKRAALEKGLLNEIMTPRARPRNGLQCNRTVSRVQIYNG